MEKSEQHLDALNDIRQMMKQSNRFLSLSGLSGVLAGVYALAGAYVTNEMIYRYERPTVDTSAPAISKSMLITNCILISTGILVLSLITAVICSRYKAKRSGYRFWDHSAQRLVVNMLIPLAAGGLFCIALLIKGGTMLGLISPVMLMFYGLALVNGSKYTLHDLRYLGCIEVAVGLVASFYMAHGLLFWAFGFGILHIIYGTIMWFKYERHL